MSIVASADSSDGRLKKGEALHWVDTKPMLLSSITNLEICAATGSTYQPTRRGDRISVDFIATGGTVVPTIEKGWPLEAVRVNEFETAFV